MDEYRDQVVFKFPKRRRRLHVSPLWILVPLVFVLGLSVSIHACHAQQPDQLQSLSLDWQSLVTAQGHVATGIEGLAQAYQAAKPKADKLDALDAYLKACQDKPGCTVPVPEAK